VMLDAGFENSEHWPRVWLEESPRESQSEDIPSQGTSRQLFVLCRYSEPCPQAWIAHQALLQPHLSRWTSRFCFEVPHAAVILCLSPSYIYSQLHRFHLLTSFSTGILRHPRRNTRTSHQHRRCHSTICSRYRYIYHIRRRSRESV
jgi:hypothetical protein